VEMPDSGIFHGVPVPVRRSTTREALVDVIERGIVLDAFLPDDEVNPGQRLPMTLLAWNGGTDTAQVGFYFVARRGWQQVGDDNCPKLDTLLAPGASVECTMTIEVIPGAFP